MVITHFLFAAFFMSEPLNHSLNKSFVNPDSFNWIKPVSLLRDANDWFCCCFELFSNYFTCNRAMDKNIKNTLKYLLLGKKKSNSPYQYMHQYNLLNRLAHLSLILICVLLNMMSILEHNHLILSEIFQVNSIL